MKRLVKPRARAVVGALALLALAVIPSSAARRAAIDLRIDFETGNGSQFSGLECPNPSTQFHVYAAGDQDRPAPRQGRYAAEFSEAPTDIWPGNNIVRCLGAKYDSNERAGDDYFYGFSLYIPETGLTNNVIWELHHPSSLYKLPECGVAPFTLDAHNGGLVLGMATGNCTVGAGYSYWHPHIVLPGLQVAPRSTWIDFLVHIRFSETDGAVYLTYRVGAHAWSTSAQVARVHVPTLPYARSAGVRDVTLYTEMGLYAGYRPYTHSDTIFIDGYRRSTSRPAVVAEFPAPAAPAHSR